MFQFSHFKLCQSKVQFLFYSNYLKQDDNGHGKAHESGEDAEATCEFSSENLVTSEVNIRAKSIFVLRILLLFILSFGLTTESPFLIGGRLWHNSGRKQLGQ